MTVLTDTSLSKILETEKTNWDRDTENRNNKILIYPFDEKKLTPVGYDLSIGKKYLKMRKTVHNPSELKDDGILIIKPDEIVVIETEEFIGMPRNYKYSGIIVSKVSIGEKGLSHISTSLDPDYLGPLAITVTNLSKRNIKLKRKQAFCTMIIMENVEPSSLSCNKSSDGHFLHVYEEWKKEENIWILYIKYLIPALPIFYLILKSVFFTVTEVEVAIGLAISSLIFAIIEKIFDN